MARPQRHPDSALVEGAASVIAMRGAAEWSLDDVGRRTGMSSAALVKRFGSKHGLLRAVVAAWVEGIPPVPPGEIDDPLGALERRLRDDFAGLDDANAIAHLGLLLAEIADPKSVLVREGWRRQQAVYTALLAAAHRQGVLRGSAPDRAGAMVMALAQGVALRWSVEPEGSLPDDQIAALHVLLEGLR